MIHRLYRHQFPSNLLRSRRAALGRFTLVTALVVAAAAGPAPAFATQARAADLAGGRAQVAEGMLEGLIDSGIAVFKGVPFAQPPVDELRWKEPQPALPWSGVREATRFGPRCMQQPVFGDMNFRSDGMGEDCLYLNLWTPARSASERLPVLVYLYGGGFVAGDGSEPRYDGEVMARRGVVAVTVNYRLGVFGFLVHPELTAESPHQASGNYGLLDQSAALHWLRNNVAAFGGDPARITIAGESAGSASVSALTVSPLSRDLIAGAILSSGAMVARAWPSATRAEAEAKGAAFAGSLGASSLTGLRTVPAERLLEAAGKLPMMSFAPIIDGYFLTEDPVATLASGRQARVPLLGGWNSEEMTYRSLLGNQEPTVERYREALRRLYPDHAEEVFEAYSATDPDSVIAAATDLAGDRFTGFSTWKWMELHAATSGQPVYRYLYARPRPPMRPEMGAATPGLAGGVVRGPQAESQPAPPARGAVHSADIEYAMGNLPTNRVYDWNAEDYKVSVVFQNFYQYFVQSGTPSGPGVPEWSALQPGRPGTTMVIDVGTRLEAALHPERYRLLDRLYGF